MDHIRYQSNSSNSNRTLTQHPDSLFQVADYVFLTFYSVVAVIGSVGNILVIKWFTSEEKRNKAGSLLVIVLAANDCIASIVTPLLEMHIIISIKTYPFKAWYLGKELCKTIPSFSYLFILTTPWILVAITCERFE